jgi:hypothetical protein
MLWRLFFIFILIFSSSNLLAEMPTPIERQGYCNYVVDYFGNISHLNGQEFATISEDKIKTIQRDCWDPVFQKKYFLETSFNYKYTTIHYFQDNHPFSSIRTPINFDFSIDLYRKHKNKMLLNFGTSLFFSFPLPNLEYTNNLAAFYGANVHTGILYPTKYGNLLAQVGGGHLIVMNSLAEDEYVYGKSFVPYASLEYQKRYQSFVGFFGIQKFISNKTTGTEQSAWLKLRYEPPTAKIQVTVSPFYRYTLQYYEDLKGVMQHFGLELGYRF